MASLTQWTWVWVSSGRWWWTGKPGVLQFVGLQRVEHNWATELNWTDILQAQGTKNDLQMGKFMEGYNRKHTPLLTVVTAGHSVGDWSGQMGPGRNEKEISTLHPVFMLVWDLQRIREHGVLLWFLSYGQLESINWGLQGGKEGRINWEVGIDTYTLLYIKDN